MTLRNALIAIAAIIIAIRCFVAMPREFTSDEQRSFGAALLDFDPYGHQPPPPSFPVYVAAGKLLNVFVRQPLPALLTLSVASAIAGVILFSLAFGAILRAPLLGIGAAFALYLSPPVRFLCSHATPEPLAFALIAAALLLWLRNNPIGAAILLALAVGVRPQLCVAAVVLLLLARLPWRAMLAFVATLAVAYEPVMENVGIRRFDLFLTSVPAQTGPLSVPLHQFMIEPWSKATLLVFAAAVIGAIVCLYRRIFAAVPIAGFTVAHLLFAAVAGTRIETVRPFIPALIGISFFAVAALSWTRWTSPPSRS